MHYESMGGDRLSPLHTHNCTGKMGKKESIAEHKTLITPARASSDVRRHTQSVHRLTSHDRSTLLLDSQRGAERCFPSTPTPRNKLHTCRELELPPTIHSKWCCYTRRRASDMTAGHTSQAYLKSVKHIESTKRADAVATSTPWGRALAD